LKAERLRESLEILNREQLIEMLLRQFDIIEKLQQEAEALRRRVEELERTAHRQAAPFRIPEEKKVTNPQKPGQKAGHPGHFRTLEETLIEETITVGLPFCPYCQGTLRELKDLEQVIEEVPPLKPKVYRVVTQSGWCTHCKRRVRSQHPLQTSRATGAAKVQLGPRAKALAVSLQYDYGLTKRKVSQLLQTTFQLPFTAGGVVHACHRSAQKLQPHYEGLCRTLQKASVVHSDETSWYVGAPHAWLWVFTNHTSTVYKVAASRGRAVISDMIGEQFTGTLVSDCLSIYDGVNEVQQKCYAHHLRAIRQAREKAGESEQAYLQEVAVLLKTAMAVKQVKPDKPPDQYRALCRSLERWADQLVLPLRTGAWEERVATRLRKQRDHLFTFLYHDEVEATNNLAERQLRPAVISRKVSCGNRTQKGAHTWEVMMSLAATAHQQQQNFQNLVSNALSLNPTH
jgi:transposase